MEHSEAKAQALDSTQRAEALQEQLERTVMSEQALLLKVGLSLDDEDNDYRSVLCMDGGDLMVCIECSSAMSPRSALWWEMRTKVDC